jgi:hypothetical membrane protein
MRLFILAGMIGSTLSILVITLDGVLRPGYSAISNAISDMGERPYGWVLNKDLIVTGILSIFFAIGIHGAMGNALGSKSVNVVTVLFLVAGAGIVNDGVFTEYKALELHILGFYTAFTALTLVFFLVGMRLMRLRGDLRWRWRHYGWYSLLTGIVVLLLTTVYVALPTYATDIQGLIERLIVGAAFTWQVVTAIQLLKPRERTDVVHGTALHWSWRTLGLHRLQPVPPRRDGDSLGAGLDGQLMANRGQVVVRGDGGDAESAAEAMPNGSDGDPLP